MSYVSKPGSPAALARQLLDEIETPMCASDMVARLTRLPKQRQRNVSGAIHELRKAGECTAVTLDPAGRRLYWKTNRPLPEGWKPVGADRSQDEPEPPRPRSTTNAIDSAVRAHRPDEPAHTGPTPAPLRPTEPRPDADSIPERIGEATGEPRVEVAGNRLPPVDPGMCHRYTAAVEVAEETLRAYVAQIDDPVLHRLIADVEHHRTTLEVLEMAARGARA